MNTLLPHPQRPIHRCAQRASAPPSLAVSPTPRRNGDQRGPEEAPSISRRLALFIGLSSFVLPFAPDAGVAIAKAGVENVRGPVLGVRYELRTTDTPAQRIHAVFVDLRDPGIRLRATRPSEAGQTTSGFAKSVDAAVTINADFFVIKAGAFAPKGLTVGDGQHWSGTKDVAPNTSFFACTADSRCVIDVDRKSPGKLQPQWHNVVGGYPVVLRAGIPLTPRDDRSPDWPKLCPVRHPRSAVGLTEDGATLILVVVEGRTPAAQGMFCSELGSLMKELGAHVALNLDGGGSSTLVVGATRKSLLPPGNGGAERVVANHLSVIIDVRPGTSVIGSPEPGDGRSGDR